MRGLRIRSLFLFFFFAPGPFPSLRRRVPRPDPASWVAAEPFAMVIARRQHDSWARARDGEVRGLLVVVGGTALLRQFRCLVPGKVALGRERILRARYPPKPSRTSASTFPRSAPLPQIAGYFGLRRRGSHTKRKTYRFQHATMPQSGSPASSDQVFAGPKASPSLLGWV